MEEEAEVKEEKAKAEEYEEDRRLMLKYIYKIIYNNQYNNKNKKIILKN